MSALSPWLHRLAKRGCSVIRPFAVSWLISPSCPPGSAFPSPWYICPTPARIAQREFRQRKQQYIKELETRYVLGSRLALVYVPRYLRLSTDAVPSVPLCPLRVEVLSANTDDRYDHLCV